MNYGRYFRLNQSLSKVVDGVAIYDYVDLPAYFGPSVDNPMSPKYPISVTVSSDAVCFRLHYSVFKVEKKENFAQILLEDGKKRMINRDFPQYAYNENDINNKTLPKINKDGLTDVAMAHMEEVILELPYTDSISNCLSDAINDIYNSTFPQVIDENTSMGGRFLEQLIRKRYPSLNQNNESSIEGNNIERQLYDELRKVSDDTASYSTLWLMDLYKEGRIDLYKIVKDKVSCKPREIIVGFLRKLLLDFMFDLKHSDVFQNSAGYQKMYSGLMSDFYFSALMHKCEYYYNRVLITKKTEQITKTIDEDTFEKEKERIVGLYANNLYKAEELWTQDIMNPNAEKYFEYYNSNKSPLIENKSIKQFFDRVFVKFYMVEDNRFLKRESWFAEPEEEMRRVCFPMDERTEKGKLVKQHICNTNTLLAYLKLKSDKDVPHEIVLFSEKNREIISRWFLRRYDFNDVCHLHLSRWANILIFFWFFFLIFLFIISNTVVEYCIKIIDAHPYLPMWSSLLFLTCIALILILKKYQYKKNAADMLSTYVGQNSQRIFNFTLLLAVIVIGVHWGRFFVVILTLIISCLFIPKCRRVIEKVFEKSTSYLHLFFPRLVASITTAWLTMTMGFDIYVAFFDQHISRGTAITIWSIVAIFVMYEINRITPKSHIWKKLLRGCQLVIISYGISLVVGTIVIDFVGRQYMDRGDGFGGITYSAGIVDTDTKPLKVIIKDITFGDLNKSQQDKVMHDVHCENNNCQSITVFHIGEHEVFFMRDFLIMFSCVTMFMGIFLQMFIFDDKKMTEF